MLVYHVFSEENCGFLEWHHLTFNEKLSNEICYFVRGYGKFRAFSTSTDVGLPKYSEKLIKLISQWTHTIPLHYID
jgi:hypothetical protein